MFIKKMTAFSVCDVTILIINDLDIINLQIMERMEQVVDEKNQLVYRCQVCYKQWIKKSKCMRHIETHIDSIFTGQRCPHCDKMFKNKPCLDAHMLQKHRGERDIDIGHSLFDPLFQ